MAIIISRDGQNHRKLEVTNIQKEEEIQEFVAKFPACLPLEEIKENVQLMTIGREFTTSSGRIDVLATDRDGDIFVVETKLFKNPDKRTVVAQALDYGAALWQSYGDPREFIRAIDAQYNFRANAKSFFSFSDEEVAALEDAIETNLREGAIKFVILMNHLDDRLKHLILYLNRSSTFSIYAVEMQFYRHEGLEIVIPNLFGAEATKVPRASAIAPKGQQWDESKFFAHAAANLTAAELEAMRQLYEFVDRQTEIQWGKGIEVGTFYGVFEEISDRALFWVFSNGEVWLLFQRLTTPSDQRIRDQWKVDLERRGFGPFDADFASRRIRLRKEDWAAKVSDLIASVKSLTSPGAT